jgi:hypothetical protein
VNVIAPGSSSPGHVISVQQVGLGRSAVSGRRALPPVRPAVRAMEVARVQSSEVRAAAGKQVSASATRSSSLHPPGDGGVR